MPQPTIYVASAGTGKTTALMGVLESLLEDYRPEQIMFTTFTNAGAKELAHRACVKYPDLSEESFRYFRTLHSIAYRNIPYRPMVNRADLIGFGEHSGYFITGVNAISKKDGMESKHAAMGDHLLALDALMRSRQVDAEEIATTQLLTKFTSNQIADFSRAYREYREALGKYDFTDMLERFKTEIEISPLPIRALLIDEAQDLSGLQWAIINEMQKTVDKYVIAGDDKQSIYAFNGGQPEILIGTAGERSVLNKSYRLPSVILNYAEEIAGRITEKQDYTVEATEEGGSVDYIKGVSELDLSEGTWFFLTRNRSYLNWIERELLAQGVLFESDTAESILAPNTLEAIAAWKELQKGFAVKAKVAKDIYAYLKSGPGVKRGGKKLLNAVNDEEFLTKEELMQQYGLVDMHNWDLMFQLPDKTMDLLKMLEEKGELGSECRIRLTTIHAVKGQEADNVVLLPDMSHMTHNEFRENPDNEHRVFYVGATRAKKRLFIHAPLTEKFYKL